MRAQTGETGRAAKARLVILTMGIDSPMGFDIHYHRGATADLAAILCDLSRRHERSKLARPTMPNARLRFVPEKPAAPVRALFLVKQHK